MAAVTLQDVKDLLLGFHTQELKSQLLKKSLLVKLFLICQLTLSLLAQKRTKSPHFSFTIFSKIELESFASSKHPKIVLKSLSWSSNKLSRLVQVTPYFLALHPSSSTSSLSVPYR